MSEYTRADMGRLYERSLLWSLREPYCDFKYLYRDLDRCHFDESIEDGGVMRISTKDGGHLPNGDRRSPINPWAFGDRPCGLFFSTKRVTDEPNSSAETLPRAFYGDTRLKRTFAEMLERCPNMYFADFYCYPKGSRHYAVLVLTDPSSSTHNVTGFNNVDEWCKERLPRIDYTRKNNLIYFDGARSKVDDC